jgi:hypothetical protein
LVYTVAGFSQFISTLQPSNPANVILTIAPPFGSSPPVVSARLLGLGWSHRLALSVVGRLLTATTKEEQS